MFARFNAVGFDRFYQRVHKGTCFRSLDTVSKQPVLPICQSPKGVDSSAVMFSLIQTAIETVLDPYRYLTWLMKTSKDANLSQEDMIHTLLP